MNKTHHVAGWKFGCIRGVEAKELHDNSGCSDSTDHSPLKPRLHQQRPHCVSHCLPDSREGIQSQDSEQLEDPSSTKVQQTRIIAMQKEKQLLYKELPLSEHHLYSRKVFLCGLNKFVTEQVTWDYFSKFGEVSAVEIIRHRRDQRSKGLGYVTFAHPEAACKVVAIPEHILQGKRITCAKYYPRLLELERELSAGSLTQAHSKDQSGLRCKDPAMWDGTWIINMSHTSGYRFNKEAINHPEVGFRIGTLIFRKYQARVVARNSA